MNIFRSEPPPKKIRFPRINKELKEMVPGQSVVLDVMTARAFAAHVRHKGLEVRTKQIQPGRIQVWVV